MQLNHKRIAGLLLFVGGVECILGIILAETLYPGYSTAENYISDLGIGPSALIFNSGVFLLGILVVSSVYFVQGSLKSRLFSAILAVSGVGALGVGIFTENILTVHAVFSFMVFAFAGISAILSFKFVKSPLSYVSVILGDGFGGALPHGLRKRLRLRHRRNGTNDRLPNSALDGWVRWIPNRRL